MEGRRFFAALYDRLLASMEKGGLTEMRAELLASARGRTLELGAGTGHNLDHYPPAVTELVLTEPDPHMAWRLRDHVEREPPAVGGTEVVEAGAESLPFEDESFDTIVSTLCLCTVEEPGGAVDEVVRLLCPGGRFLFLEHVRSDNARLARWQDRLDRPWGWIAGGCHPNRDTKALLPEAGFSTVSGGGTALPKAAPLIRPAIKGEATKA